MHNTALRTKTSEALQTEPRYRAKFVRHQDALHCQTAPRAGLQLGALECAGLFDLRCIPEGNQSVLLRSKYLSGLGTQNGRRTNFIRKKKKKKKAEALLGVNSISWTSFTLIV